MPTPDRSFVNGLFWRMLALGALSAVLVTVLFSWRYGYSVGLGALVGATSLRVSAIALSRLFRGAAEGASRSIGWMIVLASKFLLLAVVIVICVIFLKVQMLAFVVGYKLIFPALIWQAKSQPDPGEPGDETDDIESP